MRHIRSRLTLANGLSLLALFVALGGTAIASVIVTSNSQVASNTISGHHPPSGDHANILTGSVNGTDILESSLGTVPSATNASHASDSDKLGGASASSYLRTARIQAIDEQTPTCTAATDPGCSPTVLQVGSDPAFSLSIQCGPSSTLTGGELKLIAHTSVSGSSVSYSATSGGAAFRFAGPGQGTVFDVSEDAGGSRYVGGQVIYRDSTRVVSVPFEAFMGSDNNTPVDVVCGIDGTSTEAGG
jgi:hypothetical protein